MQYCCAMGDNIPWHFSTTPVLTLAALTSSSGLLCALSHTNPHINCIDFVCMSWFQHSWSLVVPVQVLNRKPDMTWLDLPVRFPAHQGASHLIFWFLVAAGQSTCRFLLSWSTTNVPECTLPVCLPVCPVWLNYSPWRPVLLQFREYLESRIDRLKVRKWGMWSDGCHI